MTGTTSVGDGGQELEDYILQTLNASIMEVYQNAPDGWLLARDRAEVVRAPTNVTLTVTQDSKSITFAGYAAWMLQCTIIIAGDPAQNMLTTDGSASVSLVKPFNGPSGATTAIVYHDSINLLPDVIKTGSPVMLDRQWELIPKKTDRELAAVQPGNYSGTGYGYMTGAYGWPGQQQGYGSYAGNFPLLTEDKQISTPLAFNSGRTNAFNAAQAIRLELSALPERRYTLTYPAMIAPFITSLADTAKPEYLPSRYDETILLPWARYKFADHPNVTMSKSELESGFSAAKAMLTRVNPQPFAFQNIQIGLT